MTLNQEAIALLREFKTDVEAAFPDACITDWPDLTVTYGKALQVLKKLDKEAKQQTRLARYKQAALAGYYENDRDGGIDFDDEPTVSKGSDPGAYVSCWAWVADIDVKQMRKDRRRGKF